MCLTVCVCVCLCQFVRVRRSNCVNVCFWFVYGYVCLFLSQFVSICVSECILCSVLVSAWSVYVNYGLSVLVCEFVGICVSLSVFVCFTGCVSVHV